MECLTGGCFPMVFRLGFPQVKFVQEDVLHFHGGEKYDRVVPASE